MEILTLVVLKIKDINRNKVCSQLANLKRLLLFILNVILFVKIFQCLLLLFSINSSYDEYFKLWRPINKLFILQNNQFHNLQNFKTVCTAHSRLDKATDEIIIITIEKKAFKEFHETYNVMHGPVFIQTVIAWMCRNDIVFYWIINIVWSTQCYVSVNIKW